MKKTVFIALLFISGISFAQTSTWSYTDAINDYQRKYIINHEVVKGDDRKYLNFFTPDSNYKVVATFEKIKDPIGFKIPTTAKSIQQYYKYGKISFTIKGVACQLYVYQSKDFIVRDDDKEDLFIPFTDATNGNETYEIGRYIDIVNTDIVNNTVVIDFNKAYNPYCAYTSGYHCPIPPKENALNVAINAGEKKYAKSK